MKDSDKALALVLDSILEKANLVHQEVLHIRTRMKALEQWQITMDTILKNTSDLN